MRAHQPSHHPIWVFPFGEGLSPGHATSRGRHLTTADSSNGRVSVLPLRWVLPRYFTFCPPRFMRFDAAIRIIGFKNFRHLSQVLTGSYPLRLDFDVSLSRAARPVESVGDGDRCHAYDNSHREAYATPAKENHREHRAFDTGLRSRLRYCI
jgi:hypothetical protein